MHPITIMLIAQSSVVGGIDFDLGKIPPPSGCAPGSTDIVVCARQRTEALGDLPQIELPAPPKAEINLFGDVKAAAEVESGNVGGFVSNRVMARVKIPIKRKP